MIVYHGSYVEVVKPDISYSRDNVDFGKGFYITSIKEQAIKWSVRFKRNKGHGIIAAYEIYLDEIRKQGKVKDFEGYTEEWMDYITTCRRLTNVQKYDVIIGGVANDKVFNTIELFLMA